MNVTEIKIRDIVVTEKDNSRTVIDPESLEDLAHSIKKNGLQQPIIVSAGKRGYDLVAGYRRLAACVLLKKDSIPASIVEVDEVTRGIVNLVENLDREGLSAFDTAKGFVRLKTEHGMSAEKIAARFKGQRGKSAPNCRNLIRSYENLEPQLLKQWAAGANWATWANVVGMSSWTHGEQIVWVNAYPNVKAGKKVKAEAPDPGGEGGEGGGEADPPAEKGPRAKSRNLGEIEEMRSVMEHANLGNPLARPAILATLAWCAGKEDDIKGI